MHYRTLICCFFVALSAVVDGAEPASGGLAGETAATSDSQERLVIDSPGKSVLVEFGLYDHDGRPGVPCYGVSFGGRTVVSRSSLGIELLPAPLGGNMRMVSASRTSRDETYRVYPGKTSLARDRYNEACIVVEERHEPHRRMELQFRAYDDGAAFRYVVPRQKALNGFTVGQEQSTFAVAGNPTAYMLPVPSYTSQYEFFYETVPADRPTTSLLALPLLFVYPDKTSLAITEAHLDDYAGMYLACVPGKPGVFASRLSPLPGSPHVKVRARLPHATPWRVMMLGANPARLIESNLVQNLNPPCAIADTSWIRTGKTAFPWWNGFDVGKAPFRGGLNTATMKYYIDFCAEAGIEYHSLDGLDNIAWYGGTIVPYEGNDITASVAEIDLPEVIRYAGEKGVKLRLWMNWLAALKHMKHAFPLYEKWGIEGIMIDFVERDDQEAVNQVRELVRLAARHRLTVTIHNVHKPTGMERTYPNVMTYEAVRNLEYVKWDSAGIGPEHDLIVPFTRMLAGPVDYHHGSFRHVTEEAFQCRNVGPATIGTRAHQLARYVVYDNQLPMVADTPEAYRGQPGLQLMVKMPTTWDETRVLHGEVGRHIAVARRHGREWYVGSMAGSAPCELGIALSFLGTGRYAASIYADDCTQPAQPAALTESRAVVTAADTITATMAPAGGHVVHLAPEE